MTKTPEEIIAEFEKKQAALDAELEKLGLPAIDDMASFDEADIYKGYPPIVAATYQTPKEDLYDTLRRLIDAGEDLNAASPYGETAIGHCFQIGALDAVRLLMDQGADTDGLGWTDTNVEIAKGKVPTSCDPMERDMFGRTPFLFACRVANRAAAKALLRRTPPEGQSDTDGEGAVSIAAHSCDPSIVAWALDQGFDVNARARFGRTALLTAVEHDAYEVAQALLKAGADTTLGENTSALLAAEEAKRGKNQSAFAKAAAVISSNLPAMMPDLPDTIATPASAAHSAAMAKLLVEFGADICDFESDMVPAALGADVLPERSLTPEQFNRHGTARAGKSNPEAYLPDFWYEQIRTGRSGYAAEIDVMGERSYSGTHVPVWSFDRFGRTATRLPDGRTIVIAGEHEDYYDSDFCIYADVTVLDGKGGIEHFIYPKEVFPPTDFHTATLIGDQIWIIGSLGYLKSRIAETAQVLVLSLCDFSIERVETSGADPGWINRHKATLDESRIIISGGNVGVDSEENSETFIFDTETREWSRSI